MNYYVENQERILARFDEEIPFWIESLEKLFGKELTKYATGRLRSRFTAFLPSLPFIGGDENSRTLWLLDAAQCLTFFQEFRDRLSCVEVGHVLFEAVIMRQKSRAESFSSDSGYTPEQVTRYRKKMAAHSGKKQYSADYVYSYVEEDGSDFGYNFTECGAYKLFKANDALEFLPYFCYLDFPKMMNTGLSLRRTKAISLGANLCNHRFLRAESENIRWPPPFAPLDD